MPKTKKKLIINIKMEEMSDEFLHWVINKGQYALRNSLEIMAAWYMENPNKSPFLPVEKSFWQKVKAFLSTPPTGNK